MSIESVAFLHCWIAQNITEADRGSGSIRAMVLADMCREAAAAKGLSVDDEPDRGTVESIIHARMQIPKSAEIAFWKVWAKMRKTQSRLH